MNNSRISSQPFAKRQNGVVLIISLIVLVAMTLAGIALLRSVDIATLIAGNLAFRQSSTTGADTGVGAGRQWLMNAVNAPAVDLTVDHAGVGYFSSWDGGAGGVFDPTTFNWAGNSSATFVDAAGNSVIYVVHRMCEHSGNPNDPAVNCIAGPSFASGGSQGLRNPPPICPPACGTPNPYYRITARSTGPRNTVAYTQVVVY
jgi:Tfp pilus assembly protein PilX